MMLFGALSLILGLLGYFGITVGSKLRIYIFVGINIIVTLAEMCLAFYWLGDYNKYLVFPNLQKWFDSSDGHAGEKWSEFQISVTFSVVFLFCLYILIKRLLSSAAAV